MVLPEIPHDYECTEPGKHYSQENDATDICGA